MKKQWNYAGIRQPTGVIEEISVILHTGKRLKIITVSDKFVNTKK